MSRMENFFLTIIKSKRKSVYAFISIVFFVTACLPYKAYIYMIPDQKDIHRFHYEEVKHSDNCYNFKTRSVNKPIYVTNWTSSMPLVKGSLEDFLKEYKADQFLVIKNDSIVFEYINEKIDFNEPAPTFSIAKTFVSAVLGVAIKEGKVGSINDLALTYLPELNYHDNFKKLTINHLLNQSSGLQERVLDISDAYYNKLEKVLVGLKFDAEPGKKLEYVNINTILVGLIIERATGRKLHEYFSENIWTKIGTCDPAVWAYDEKTNHTRSFCCFGSSSRDYAKFGKLYMNKGRWGGKQIIDSNWVATTTNSTNTLGEAIGYNSYWFIGEKEVGDYLSIGMFRQQIYVNPKENVIIVSLMKFNGNTLPLRWWQLLRQIAAQA